MEQPKIYSLMIFKNKEVTKRTLNKIFLEVLRFDMIYTTQQVLELDNSDYIKIGAYSADVARVLTSEIKKITKDIKIEISEVKLC